MIIYLPPFPPISLISLLLVHEGLAALVGGGQPGLAPVLTHQRSASI